MLLGIMGVYIPKYNSDIGVEGILSNKQVFKCLKIKDRVDRIKDFRRHYKLLKYNTLFSRKVYALVYIQRR